jgi:serine/threonine protein kinase/tetratricopeptide (TPR) repeat protein
MAAPNQESTDREERLGQAVFACLQELEAGRRLGRDELRERFPDLADDLAHYLAGREHFEGLAAPLRQVSGVELTSEAADTFAAGEPLGNFRIVRRVGQGGMGVVYEAVQRSLNRRVALKVLPLAGALDPKQLRRFQNEAQAAAHLQHQHIVPVYFVGCERGVHFYAMQFIDGPTLAQVIAQLRQSADAPAAPPPRAVAPAPPGPGGQSTAPYSPPSILPVIPAPDTVPPQGLVTERSHRTPAYSRTVARLGQQAAEALHQAHELGVVHRDVKPGNLLLDGRGELWVADFGLARMQTEASLTLSGDLVGTVRYMSPEQALANRVPIDHRTDVYSLGATLYELLTLRPVFEGKDRQELLRKITFDEPVPLRRWNPAIPAELETVVLKALEKRPEDRYATAQELADDLRRVLEDQPIRARRPGLAQRLRKWGRRHKAVVWAAAVCLLVTLASVIGSVGWVMGDRAARQREAEAKVREALEVAAPGLRQGNPDDPALIAAVQRAQALLDQGVVGPELAGRVEQLRRDQEMLAKLEQAQLQMGAAGTQKGLDAAAADRLYTRAFKSYGTNVLIMDRQQAAGRLRTSAIRTHLVAALDHWGLIRNGLHRGAWTSLSALADLADDDRWRQRLRRAVWRRNRAALEELAREKGALRQPPTSLDLLARALIYTSSLVAAERLLRSAQQAHPADFKINWDLALTLHKKGSDLAEAVRFYQAALSLKPDFAGVYNNMGHALRGQGKLVEAEAALRTAIKRQPGDASAHCNLGCALADKGRLDEAIAEFREAVRIENDSAENRNDLGSVLHAKGRLDEAIAEYREALRLKNNDAMAHNGLGVALRDKGRLDEAIAEFHEAIRLKKNFAEAHNGLGVALRDKGRLDEAIVEGREDIRVKNNWTEAHCNLGVALADKGRLDEAIAEYREAIGLKKNLPEAHNGLGVALRDKGRLDEAIVEGREAIRLKKNFAEAHNSLGAVLFDKGRLKEAVAEYREALRIKKDFPVVHSNLGCVLVELGQLEEGIAELRQALQIDEDDAQAHMMLGFALTRKGLFPQALKQLRRGQELGSRKPGWNHAEAQFFLRQAEQMARLDYRLSDVLGGKDEPKDAAERLDFAQLCLQPCRKQYAAAVRFCKEAFTADLKLAEDMDSDHRYNAACAAALAGCVQGQDAASLGPKERRRFRRQALEWLRADFKARRKQVRSWWPGLAAKARTAKAGKALKFWQQDPDLAGVREPAALAKLLAAERQGWHKLWEDVEALLRQTAASKVP